MAAGADAVPARPPAGVTRAPARAGARATPAPPPAASVPPKPAPRAICLVPAPSRPSAARVRGGPHVERLVHEAASVLAARGIEVAVAPALTLAASARDAVGLGREQRRANLASHLRFREAGRPPPGFAIVVLDDVITTGATAAACVAALAAEGFTVSAVLALLAAG
ncbi:ComF family protein [Amycolatopsis sp. NPDC004747]